MVQYCDTYWCVFCHFLLKISEKIRGQLIPSLYEARTYIELGYYESPTVDISIKKSMLIASDLRDQNSKYAPLFSKLNILKELKI